MLLVGASTVAFIIFYVYRQNLLRTAKGESQVPALQSCVRTCIVELDIVRSLALLKEELYEVLCLYRTQKTVYDRDMSIL